MRRDVYADLHRKSSSSLEGTTASTCSQLSSGEPSSNDAPAQSANHSLTEPKWCDTPQVYRAFGLEGSVLHGHKCTAEEKRILAAGAPDGTSTGIVNVVEKGR